MTADGRPVGRWSIVVVVAGALLVAACARGETLGADEAVEVMVLDGVDRVRATCVVDALDGVLELAKVTGLDTDLAHDELGLLATTTAGCTPAVASGGGVIGGSGADPIDPIGSLADPALSDAATGVERFVDTLVEGGLDAGTGSCLLQEILATDEPTAVLGDDGLLSELTVDCARLAAG